VITIDKSKVKIVVIVIGVLLICIGAWYMCSSRNVSDNGDGANAVTEQLGNARDAEQSAADSVESISTGLQDAQGTVDELTESNSNAQNTANNITESVSESYERATNSADIIRQCKQIVSTVRERGKSETN
jgi:hypothetical protein